MVIEKEWHTINELSEKWLCSVDDILYLGISGKLKLNFDWVVCKIESDTLNLSNISIFEFVTVDDIYYCPGRKASFESLIPIPEPEHKNAPLLRLATLTEDQLALINKNGKASITRAMLSIHDCIDINLPQGVEIMIYPKVSTKDIVVKLSDIIEFENITVRKVPVEASKPESSKEIENLRKLLGLVLFELANKSGNSLKHMGKPSAKAIADRLELIIPEGMDTSGIGNESNRKKISACLKMLEPDNF
jgi:hypothetical protein